MDDIANNIERTDRIKLFVAYVGKCKNLVTLHPFLLFSKEILIIRCRHRDVRVNYVYLHEK